jgi:hypothetical protein
LDAKPRAARDLVREFQLDRGDAMEPLGLRVDFRTPDGHSVAPPQLGARLDMFPAPSLVKGGDHDAGWAGRADPVSLVSAIIVPLSQAPVEDDGRQRERRKPLIDATSVTSSLMDARDVVRLNREASVVALEAARELGGEASGVTGFYAPRAQQRELLQSSEVLCAHFVQTRLPKARAVYEIGCGLGLLSTLLSHRGVEAIGVERNGARLATAERIALKVADGAKSPKWIKGSFPKALRGEGELGSSVALVTNLLGSATAEQQDTFIKGLADFGAVVIDTHRFYERRVTTPQIEELCDRFLQVGFSEPQLAFDVGLDGYFMLFLNPRPRQRLGLKAILSNLGLANRTPLLLD